MKKANPEPPITCRSADAGGHSELLTGDRPDVDARLIRDVMHAAADRETGGEAEIHIALPAGADGDRSAIEPLAGAESAATGAEGSVRGGPV